MRKRIDITVFFDKIVVRAFQAGFKAFLEILSYQFSEPFHARKVARVLKHIRAEYQLVESVHFGFAGTMAGYRVYYPFFLYSVLLFRDDGSVKVSRAIKSTAKKMNTFIEEYSVRYGRPPTVKQIAEEFGVEESEAVFIMGSSRMPVSIYAEGSYKDERSQSLIERLPAADDQDELVEKLQLRAAIDGLAEREKKIIMLRYFRDMTQSEVAAVIGVSQVQISRIESRVMQDMKKKLD